MKRVRKLGKGLKKKDKNLGPIRGNSEKSGRNKKGVRKDEGVASGSVDSRRKHNFVEKSLKKKNVVQISDDDDDESSEDEDEDFGEASVGWKKNRKSIKRVKKIKNDDSDDDDDGSENEDEDFGEASVGWKKNRKSIKRVKKHKNDDESDDDGSEDEDEDFDEASIGCKKNKKLIKRVKKDKNDDDDEESEDDVEYIVVKRVKKSEKGLNKKNKNVVQIPGNFKKHWKNRKGVKKDNNVVIGLANLVKKHKSVERLKKNKNVVQMSDYDDDESEYEVENFVKASVDLKKNKKKLKKNKNVVQMDVDDYESDGDVQFLVMKDKNGRVIEGAEDDVVDSNYSSFRKESKSEEFSNCKRSPLKGREEVASCHQKRKKSACIKLKDRKSCGVLSQARSRLGASKKGKKVIPAISNDSEDLDELSNSQDVIQSESDSDSDSTHSADSTGSSDSGDSEGSVSSSEEASDRSRDKDYRVDNSSRSVNSDDSSSSSEDENESGFVNQVSPNGKGKDKMVEAGKGKEKVFDVGSVEGKEKEKMVEVGLKRGRGRPRKVVSLGQSISCSLDGVGKDFEPKSVAERLRLRQRVCKSKNSEKKKQEIGSFSGPFALRDEDEDEIDGDGNTCFQSGNDVWKVGEKGGKREGKEEVARPTKRSHNGVDASASIIVEKILADSIWEKEGDVRLENLVSPGDGVPDQETTLSLRFRFGFEDDPKPPEKSYWDIEADKLFAEMEFALTVDGIGGSSDASMGKHPLWGFYRKDFCKTDHFSLDELQFQDSAFAYQSGSKQYIREEEGTVWDIIPGVKRSMYPHQREGFEFIWKNIAGDIYLKELKEKAFGGGSGCIISHAPGTGKTRLTIVFLQTYMKLCGTCRPVIIAPCSMLLTWEEEFRKWKVDIPFHNLNTLEFSGRENPNAVSLLTKYGRQRKNHDSIRMVKLYSWTMDRSILGISYRLFEKLVGDSVLADAGTKRAKSKHFNCGEQVRRMLLEIPTLLVLDEGHTPRNDQSLIWKAVSRVETQKRIILSGTPFQNNFSELYNTLCLVRPKFTDGKISETQGDSTRKRGLKSSAEARGQWASLTSTIGKDADDNDRLNELKTMIKPFVHVHKGSILTESLPGLRDSLVVLQPTLLQKTLIEVIQGRKNPLELDYLVSLISVHPSLLLACGLSAQEQLSVDTNKLEMLKLDPGAGVKTKFLVELIRLSEALKEKVLVFSQFIDSLTFIRRQLTSHFDWTEGKEVLYMDGALDIKHRQSSISFLNDPESEVRVLLASTKACSEGINLVGASRVVLLDVVWNPSVERQAISRAYRLGQKKVVYIYHLIMSGTKEGEKYLRQAEKDRLSELVFSSVDGVHKPEISCTVAEDIVLQEMVQHEKTSHMFEKILNQPKESNLIDTFG
ncbi:hypothetical protein CsSME_00049938 [Camellia sinensis var. sinensis]